MSIRPEDQAVVEGYFRAMHARATGDDGMAGLFAEDAVYLEPFSAGPAGGGKKQTHVGRQAISAFFEQGWKQQPPDMSVSLDRMDIEGDAIRAEWTCRSAAFPFPMRGYDVYLIRNGKIARLETTLLAPGSSS